MRTMIKLLGPLLFLTIVVWEAAQAKTVPPQGQNNQAQKQPPPPQGQTTQEQSNQNQATQDGIEIQARGQVHEAFASPAMQRQAPTPIVRKKPPEPINELPPDQKPEGDNVQWIPGYWMWDEDRSDFLWLSGTWRAIPPEKRWLPGYWVAAEGGSRWVSGYWVAQTETHVNLYPEPPAPLEEAIPVIDDASQTYIPGIWVYRENRYWWRPGFRTNYQPGWVWNTAGYQWTPGGYAFVDGYWDYDLSRRGLAFAPVYFNSQIIGRPNWYYRPNYVISTDFLLGSLFVNTGWNHYYFGDYYDRSYAQRGYSPWVTYRTSNRLYDPLYSYYRWQNRGDQSWERNIQNGFTARQDGSMPRPGRTLALLEKSGTGTGQPGSRVSGLVALNQWKGDQFKLQRLSEGEDKKIVEHFRNLSTERSKNEVGKRTSLYPRENVPGKEGQSVPRENLPGTKDAPHQKNDTLSGRRDTPPEKQESQKLPPAKQETPLPERKDTLPGNNDAPGKADAPKEVPSGTGTRYELPKSNQTYRPPTGEKAPPERPAHPQPQQNPPGKGSVSPGKNPGKPGN